MGILANFYSYFITFTYYGILTHKTDSLSGWNNNHLSILYGISILTYSIAGVFLWYTAYLLEDIIITGQMDIFLLRPLGILQQMVFQKFGDTFIGQIIVTFLFLSKALYIEKIELSMLLYVLYIIIGGIFFQTGSMMLFGSLSFWTLKSKGLIRLLYYDLRDLTKYPITIYPSFVQILLTFILPWSLINYYPTLFIIGKSDRVFEIILAYISPLIGVLWFILSLFVFNRGLKKYASSGS